MKVYKIGVATVVLMGSSLSMATEIGNIEGLMMSGPNDPDHPNVVQLDLGVDAMSTAGCNARYAAIRKNSDTNHMISLATSALMANRTVTIELDTSDIYYSADNRCVITRISILEPKAINLAQFSGFRAWDDNSYAQSCNEYLNPSDGVHHYQGATGDGVYRILPDGESDPSNVYCDMTTDDGGWMVVDSSFITNYVNTYSYDSDTSEFKLLATTTSSSSSHYGAGLITKVIPGISEVRTEHTGGSGYSCAGPIWDEKINLGESGMTLTTTGYYPGFVVAGTGATVVSSSTVTDEPATRAFAKGDYRIHLGLGGYSGCARSEHTTKLMVR